VRVTEREREREGHLKELAEAAREVLIVGVNPGQHLQQGIQRAPHAHLRRSLSPSPTPYLSLSIYFSLSLALSLSLSLSLSHSLSLSLSFFSPALSLSLHLFLALSLCHSSSLPLALFPPTLSLSTLPLTSAAVASSCRACLSSSCCRRVATKLPAAGPYK
jgi:hypothetical protein